MSLNHLIYCTRMGVWWIAEFWEALNRNHSVKACHAGSQGHTVVHCRGLAFVRGEVIFIRAYHFALKYKESFVGIYMRIKTCNYISGQSEWVGLADFTASWQICISIGRRSEILPPKVTSSWSVRWPFICLLQRQNTSSANFLSHNVGLTPLLLWPDMTF